HFTPELLDRVAKQGVRTLPVALQVGAGTFKLVETETLGEHSMHREWCHVPCETLRALHALAAPRAAGAARLIVVGTTGVRTLESLPNPIPSVSELGAEGWSTDTRLLIQPGFEFRFTDALLTNFHLPKSTLLSLVGAFVGLDRLKHLYAEAQTRGYRFFSYGDAMLIV
ncbi:MAG: S-adenosylmethionine:tRNA ribosyltransferase-isomerase, partial [Phycisphaerae bacterium]|nr:S-adenosylmethionine:tRNA ribosyltransferase-isomerase [Phycisphaerae bacterium]